MDLWKPPNKRYVLPVAKIRTFFRLLKPCARGRSGGSILLLHASNHSLVRAAGPNKQSQIFPSKKDGFDNISLLPLLFLAQMPATVWIWVESILLYVSVPKKKEISTFKLVFLVLLAWEFKFSKLLSRIVTLTHTAGCKQNATRHVRSREASLATTGALCSAHFFQADSVVRSILIYLSKFNHTEPYKACGPWKEEHLHKAWEQFLERPLGPRIIHQDP